VQFSNLKDQRHHLQSWN